MHSCIHLFFYKPTPSEVSMAATRRHIALTIKQRYDILEKLKRGHLGKDLAKKYNVGTSTISDVKRNYEKIKSYVNSCISAPIKNKLRKPEYPKMESELYDWFLTQRQRHSVITSEILMEKAKHYDNDKNCENQKDNFSISDLSTEYPIENYTNSSQSDTLSDVIVTTKQISTPVTKNNPIPYISPFVTINRGKDSARKEFHSRKSKGGLCDSSPEMQSSTGPRAGAVYFHKLLDGEISRIQGLCNEWNLYKEEQNPPEEACDMINVAIGQSQLLLNKKFKQFRNLIKSCESGDSEQIITCEDLHGYWDTAYMQVENLNQRFENLVNLRANNWEEIIPVKKVVAVKKTAKVGYKPKVQASSRLKDAIKAARNKAKTVQEKQDSLVGTNVFDGGFFAVHSPEKSPTHALTSRNRNSVNTRKSLLVDVLTTQALKQENSPGLIMIKASQTAKALDNATTTPGSSILKTNRAKSSGKKSKSVLFKEANGEESEENLILFTPDEGSSKINTRRSISNVRHTPKSVLLNDNVPVGKLISFTLDEGKASFFQIT
ncbi:disks large-associated protein dap sap90/psd-95-associated protein [Holotrichia oblita]|uniref:Disks large-associated protein dap sap90/psd-95-associated protein n=1 Tax=Holotrichia oblita TaxID=644536 RepID=A0ACB9T2K8_HOLOL|nr:disks large-associated protein dap sap90/psd-95-associated protein [Holotrichia oblita]